MKRIEKATFAVIAVAASTMGIGASLGTFGHFWRKLADPGGIPLDSPKFGVKFTRLTQKPYCNSHRFTVTYAYKG